MFRNIPSERFLNRFFNGPYVHFLRNALDYLPRKGDDDCLQELRWLYARRNVAEAQHDLGGVAHVLAT